MEPMEKRVPELEVIDERENNETEEPSQFLVIVHDDEKNEETEEEPAENSNPFVRLKRQFARLKSPITKENVKNLIQQFFKVVEEKKSNEIHVERDQRQVSLKLGFMTGKKELHCDFCGIEDRFYAGAMFGDLYVDGTPKWMMCPSCLTYCKEQGQERFEQRVRARFHQLAARLERDARRARNLATVEAFQVPNQAEWEAWETAAVALEEAAAGYEQRMEEGDSFHEI
jgi:hypothetical protein